MDPEHDREFSTRINTSGANDVDTEAILTHPIDRIRIGLVIGASVAILSGRSHPAPCLVQALRYSESVLPSSI
jgi:hypothetical protein